MNTNISSLLSSDGILRAFVESSNGWMTWFEFGGAALYKKVDGER